MTEELKKETTRFEIYAESIHGSDVLCADTFDEAVFKANAWAKESDCPIVVVRITEQIAFRMKGRKESKQ